LKIFRFLAQAADGQIFQLNIYQMNRPERQELALVNEIAEKILRRLHETFKSRGIKMSSKFFDVIVAKEYEIRQNGRLERKTAWNRVGRAWTSKSSESMSFELFLIPNQRYVIQLKDKNQDALATEEMPVKEELL
jgi:hypothetical protein